MNPSQLSLDFHPGITVQHKTLTSVTAATVYGHRGGLSAVAADLDTSPSDLTRRLSGGDEKDNRPLTVEQFDAILASTKDFRPIFWLIEKYLQDPETKKNQAINQLATLVPMIARLVEQAGITPKVGKTR